MKKGLHPKDYRLVVFQDTSSDFKILTRSTAKSTETIKWEDGQEYPLIKVHVSSASHPFFTGEEKVLDVEGRVDKFKARREAAEKAREAAQERAKKSAQKAKPPKKENSSGKDKPSTDETPGAVEAKKRAEAAATKNKKTAKKSEDKSDSKAEAKKPEAKTDSKSDSN